MRSFLGKLMAMALLIVAGQAAAADDRLKPFVLGYKAGGDMQTLVAEVREKLTGAGFEIVGEYAPYETAHVIGITNDALREAASHSDFGGYGAVQRVSVTRVDGELQVAYTNPTYMAHGYRMAGDLADVTAQMAQALGAREQFGPDKGLKPKKLRKYHYMFGMEYFDEPSVLAEYDSYEAAVAAVEANLAKSVSGVSKVYRVDIPGKQESVFGVAMKKQDEEGKYQDDEYIMSEIDFKPLRSTPHLPYEMLVSGNKVYALYARFRIAVNFPDLSMMGSHSFMNIMAAPKAIEKALMKAAEVE